jgi:pentatricopeptide repeat protein
MRRALRLANSLKFRQERQVLSDTWPCCKTPSRTAVIPTFLTQDRIAFNSIRQGWPFIGARTQHIHTRSQHKNAEDTPLITNDDQVSQKTLNSTRSKALLLSTFHKSLGTQDIDTIWPLYVAMHRNGLAHHFSRRLYRNIFLYTTRAKATHQNLQRLLYIVSDMKAHGMKIRLTEYNTLIRWTGGKTMKRPRGHQLSEALALLEELQQDSILDDNGTIDFKINPDIITYNTLISVACSVADLRTAQKLYHEMKARNVQPNIRTYTSLLSALARVHDIRAMEMMVDRIRSKGIPNVDNTVTWNALLAGYSINGMKDNVHDMFRQMVDRAAGAPPPDAETFRVYIESLLHSQRLSEALGCLGTMESHGITPIAAIYNAFFDSLTHKVKSQTRNKVQDGSSEKSIRILNELYDDMKKRKVQANSRTMHVLVTALLDNGATNQAFSTFVELSQKGNQESKPFDPRLSVKQLTEQRATKKPNVSIIPNDQLTQRLHLLLAEQEQSLEREQSHYDWEHHHEDTDHHDESTSLDYEETHVYCH